MYPPIIKSDIIKRANSIWSYTQKYRELRKKYLKTDPVKFDDELYKLRESSGESMAWLESKKELYKAVYKAHIDKYNDFLQLKKYYI